MRPPSSRSVCYLSSVPLLLLAMTAQAQGTAGSGQEQSEPPARDAPLQPSPAAVDPAAADPDDLFRQIFGKERPQLIAGDYGVLVDGIYVGDYHIIPAKGSEGRVDVALLRAALIPIALEELAAALQRLTTAETASFSDLRALGMTVTFDPGELILRISVPPSKRMAQQLLLRGARHRADLNYAKQADVSAYVSVRAGIDLIEKSTIDSNGFSGFVSDVDIGANILGLAAQARFRYDERRRRPFSRQDIRLTYDDVAHLVRYELGDLSVGRRPFQLAPRIAGFAAFREYPIDPYRNIRPTPEQGFELTEDARVEVYLNGAPVRSFSLTPGRYSLRDFPLVPSAANDIELRITYASGRTEILVYPAFYDIELLQPGLTDFAFNIGLPYRDEDGRRIYDDHNYNLLGYIRRGMSDTLTAGLNWEGDRHFDTVGAELVWASPIGSFALNAATNARKPALGSSRFSMQYAWRDADPARGRAIDAQIILTGEDYRTLNQLFGGNVVRLSAQARAGQMINLRTRAQLYGGYEDAREFGKRYYVGANLTHQLGFGSLSVGAEYRDTPQESGFVFRASLSVPLGSGTASASYSSEDNAFRAEYNRLAALGVGSFGFSGGVERRDGYDRQYARATYIGNRFEAGVEQVRAASRGGERDMRTGFTVGTALVMADGAFGISRPITNSFALIGVDKDMSDYRIAVEPRRGFGSSRTTYSAYSDALGPAVVSTLPPYFNRTLQIDAPDAPAGTSLDSQVFMVRPGYRSGYRLKVGSDANVSVVGTLVGSGGGPLAYATGEARRVGAKPDEEPLALFTNAGGRFFLEGALAGQRYQLTVRLGAETAQTMIQVPEDIVGIHRVDPPINLPLTSKDQERKP